MRLRCGAATAALLAVVGSAAPARAQHVEYKASITLTGAYTRSMSDYQYPTAQTFTVVSGDRSFDATVPAGATVTFHWSGR